MTFHEFLAEVQKLKCEEQRAQEEDYLEIVIAKAMLDLLHKTLGAYFGAPLKPEGQSPSGEANRSAKPYGGIRRDQTMYFRQDGDLAECALLWPWGGGDRITVKISRSQSITPAKGLWEGLTGLFGRK